MTINGKIFEQNNIIIYFKDSSKMPEVDNDTVVLVVTSPPYFNYVAYGDIGIGTEENYQGYLINLKKVFEECFRILIPDGKFCINISNMKARKDIEGKSFVYPIVADVTRMFLDIGYIFFDEIVWVKGSANAGALKGKPLFGSYPYPPNPKILDSIFENILIFKKDGRLENRVDELSKKESIVSKEDWRKYTKGIWQFEPDRGSDHPASFPIELPTRLIKLYSFKGEMVLDPFVGTGTTVIAADMLGRKGIGYEIYDGYEGFIQKKMDKYINQLSIFKL